MSQFDDHEMNCPGHPASENKQDLGFYMKGHKEGINDAISNLLELKIDIEKNIPGGFDHLGLADYNYKTGYLESLARLYIRLTNILKKDAD